VVYFSDNGPNGWRWNGGMKGKKGSTDEGGVRSPFFIRWPGRIKPGTTIPRIAGAIDLLPTLADLCGVPLVGDKTLDGVSIKPLLLGPATDWPERMLFNAWRGRVSVRTQQYRLDSRGKLFDIDADPGQKTDVSKQHPDLAAGLKRAVADWKTATRTSAGSRPFTVGHPGCRTTCLPARDGNADGFIKRSNRFPNGSFFTGWTNTEDTITWDVEVLTAGTYEAVVYYTCPAGDEGSVVELAFGDARLRCTVGAAHDPPLLGAAEDRVPRKESYAKDFRPLNMGAIRLARGQGTLRLKALSMPGRTVMDVRRLVLRRID
jgi:hypothetical protein